MVFNAERTSAMSADNMNDEEISRFYIDPASKWRLRW